MTVLKLDGDYYKHFLGSATFPYTEDERGCIERTVSKMMDTPTYGSKPGMLLGKIQSGKTKTFMAIMGLAFDNGYEVSIVLTKGTSALSQQTEQRISKDFKPFIANDDVLLFDIMRMPGRLSGYELKKKIVIVVKKQKDNLRRMLDLFRHEKYEFADKKVLVVDDEADYASVGFSSSEGVASANLTTTRLDELRKEANDVTFLQVTATPYSLYLQPEDVEVNGNAFQPIRPAFTELVPVNEAYVGSDFYFDDCDEPESMASQLYIPLSLTELAVMKSPDRRRFKEEEVLTASMVSGIRSACTNFLVGGAIRQLQDIESGDPGKKFSLLVHTEIAKASHEWQKRIVESLFEAIQEESGNETDLFKSLIRDAYDELEKSIALSDFHLPPFKSVYDRVREALEDEEFLITSVNSDHDVKALLDDSGQLKLRTPLNVFIGGQILDRGITIGNLIGFYYGRKPQRFQQDTVLQHSRMYGYRPMKDMAVTRFYTEQSIYNAMRRMHESDVALREEIEKNPEQSVVFIQGSTSGAVVPCSPNKILLTETTTLKRHKRILPVGFQTNYKSYTKPVTDKLDAALESIRPEGPGKEPFKITREVAHDILNRIEPTINMSEEEGYAFNWKSMHSAIDYMAGLSSDQDSIWCLWLADRNNNRLAGAGSHTKYVATPDTASSEGAIAKQTCTDSPMLMLFRQNGLEEQGWKGAPFYWPLLYASGNVPTTIYANVTADG